MENEIIDSICREQCFKFGQQFRCIELKKIQMSPLYTFEIASKKTALHCKVLKGKTEWEPKEKNLEMYISEYKFTHKIVRLEIYLNDNNLVIEVKPIITHELAA